MAPKTKSKPAGTSTKWTHEFDTLRREHLFRNPPTDHSAYPLLQAAVNPHIESYNAILAENGLLHHAIADIGTKTYLDGDDSIPLEERNKFQIRLKQVYVEKPKLPDSNKFSTRNREILPSECRERHSTYRGIMTVKVEYRVNNGDWKETTRGLGQMPIMLKVRCSPTYWPVHY